MSPHVASDAAPHHARFLRTSARGVAFLIAEEGIRLAPYKDSRGLVTAAVGHLVTPPHTTITEEDRRRWTFRSRGAAVAWFRAHDLPVYEEAVRRALGDALIRQAQFDMCVSLCFNIGTGGFAHSRVAALIRAGKRRSAAFAFLSWSKPWVLHPRRLREMRRFLRGRWS